MWLDEARLEGHQGRLEELRVASSQLLRARGILAGSLLLDEEDERREGDLRAGDLGEVGMLRELSLQPLRVRDERLDPRLYARQVRPPETLEHVDLGRGEVLPVMGRVLLQRIERAPPGPFGGCVALQLLGAVEPDRILGGSELREHEQRRGREESAHGAEGAILRQGSGRDNGPGESGRSRTRGAQEVDSCSSLRDPRGPCPRCVSSSARFADASHGLFT